MQLNYSVTFVAQVRSFKEGKLSIDACRRTLADACTRHGISLIYPPLAIDKGVSVDKRMPDVSAMPDDESVWKCWVGTNYFAFLSETNLVLQASRFSDEYNVIVGPYVIAPTARAWGQLYADWANSISWLNKADWKYVDFYAGDLTDDYWDWAEAAFRVVKEIPGHK